MLEWIKKKRAAQLIPAAIAAHYEYEAAHIREMEARLADRQLKPPAGKRRQGQFDPDQRTRAVEVRIRYLLGWWTPNDLHQILVDWRMD